MGAWWTLGKCGCRVSIHGGKPQVFEACSNHPSNAPPAKDPHWPPGITCSLCQGDGIHAPDCPIVVQRMRGG
jgi:hypothetical protein